MFSCSLDLQIYVCRPTYFYNVSQRHNYIVNDYRPTKSEQRLKNTFKIDSITYLDQINQITATQELQQFTSDYDNEGMQNLFKQRKRIFNFFLPFESSDSFSIYLSDHLYTIDEVQNHQFHDYFSVPFSTLEEIIHKYRNEIKDGLIPSRRQQPLQNIQQVHKSPKSSSPQMSVERQSPYKRLMQYKGFSSPNLFDYNVLVHIINLNEEQEISNITVFESMLSVMKLYKLEKTREIFLINEPGKIIFNYYPLLDYILQKNKKFLDKTLPNEIVLGKIYLGNADHAMNEDLLINSLKITHILNATKEVKNALTGVTYLKISICDEVTEQIFEHFDIVYSFIDGIWDDENSKILIHCAQGRSRSAALVIMFLMKKFNWSLNKAHDYVKERREVVNVNDGFMDQLERYETQLLMDQVSTK